MAKEQKAIAKFLDKNGIVVDFWRFPIKNINKILNQVLELESQLSLSKENLMRFDSFLIQETEPNGTVINTVYECDDSEFLKLLKEFYADKYGYYPYDDKWDYERWGDIMDCHKGYKESKKSARKSLKESTNNDIENYIDDLKTYSKKDVPSDSKSYYFWSYYEFNISDDEWIKVSLSGKDYAKSLKDANNLAKSDDVVKAYLVFKNPNNPNENFKVIIKENDFYESKKYARKSLKEEKATDSLFEDVVFSMIKKFKLLKKEYDVERPSWTVFNFRHKNKDAQFAITFDERGHDDFLYGDVLAFGDEKDDIFKYKTDEVKVDSYNIGKKCLNIIADCLVFIDTNKKITIFESKKSTKRSLTEGISAFNKAIAKKYNETEPNSIGQYYLDWRFDLHDEKANIEAIADRCGVTVEFQTDEGYFEVFEESKKSIKKSLKESVDGFIATDEDCNMSGEGWILDGSYNFIMDFLREWGIAPKDVKVHKGMTTLFNADGNPFGYVYQDEEVDIFVVDKTTNWTWKNHNPSTKRVKVTALDEMF